MTNRFAVDLAPYKIEVVQGNFISREQVQALKAGMSRQQVRDLMGTPLLASVFHADRWDYIFTLRRQGVAPQSRRLTVYFQGDVLTRFEGDDMPTEAEFITQLNPRMKTGKPVLLEASEESLSKFPAQKLPASDPAAAAPLPPVYPPLEAAPAR
ncbi:MAG: outer membrane protein assembly factor BamE [Burkholderiaceae bacterium]|nr:outer membrane protein assembly factor BamE [Burkholderiaceae bacterium]MDP1969132.1 outer membrane protein assembly factor BamE [Burkholderiaceae bacterium]